ncbi:MAG: 16S rRNA (guanine(966)-N(2))-methyltransferase RsmD [Firmicutes bacterium]|nr:16S rRNA (guanine(966)-N(2))-methyltransferase RsmD [Bacillota bacterium]
MRVIAGAAKGRRLDSVKGLKTRPTSDRVKESLFSILGERVAMGRFLDLYAGSGAVGIEALSRGAPAAVFVDHSRAAVQVIRRNLERTGLAELAEVYQTNVERAVSILAKRRLDFACIFLDPPYSSGRAAGTLAAIDQSSLAGPDTLVIVEHGRQEEVPERVGSLRLCRVQAYGDTKISFLLRQDSIDY